MKKGEEGDSREDDVAGQSFVAGIGVRGESSESDHEGSAGPEEVGDGVDDPYPLDHHELERVPDIENLIREQLERREG